ncbi:hypothetical protein BJX68DRAFT_54459 [Aspergillus pseudodeflectus]|uniref:Amino acid permease/ SLC12A domain-containing protein n=1 Tax=Aspergillus pseudodeflectus TaxID=176178 RepID=A0ABR4KK02_9EURO
MLVIIISTCVFSFCVNILILNLGPPLSLFLYPFDSFELRGCIALRARAKKALYTPVTLTPGLLLLAISRFININT